MKKIAVYTVALAVLSIVIVSCHKNSGPYPGSGPNSLWPLKAGNTWIYQDSVFSDSAFTRVYPDTIVENGRVIQDQSGSYYLGISNPNGWFGNGSYLAVDPANYTIYEVDSPAFSPYVFFQTASQDGTVIGTGNDYTNPACPLSSVQYGFASNFTIAGYNCLKNIEYVTNCSNVNTEAIVTYVSPGIGLVRIEDYVADSTHNNNLYIDYSMTLKSQTLH